MADPLVLVPLVILDFLCIHPFPDGNGRMARLLTLQLLYHFDYELGRFISLERIFEESKESYYETLEASSQGWQRPCSQMGTNSSSLIKMLSYKSHHFIVR